MWLEKYARPPMRWNRADRAAGSSGVLSPMTLSTVKETTSGVT